MGERFCPGCGLANPDAVDLDRDGFDIAGTTKETPPSVADMRSSIMGIGALIGVLTLVAILFLVTAPDELEAEEAVEATPTPTLVPTPTGIPIESPPPPPTATPVSATALPTPDLADLLGSLDLGSGRLLVAEIGEVAAYDLETGERDQVAGGVLNTAIVPVVSWRGVSWRPVDGSAWITSFWGGDREQSPLPADFDPGFSVSAPLDGAVYTEVVFGTIDNGRQLLATHLATGEDVMIDLPRDVLKQVLAGWPPQIRALRDSLYISSGGEVYRWRFSAREWTTAGRGTLVATTGPGVLVNDCSIDSCSVRGFDAEGESIDLSAVDPSILPGAPGEFAAVSPDGTQLAFSSIGSTATLRGLRIVRIVDLATGIARDVDFDNQNLDPRNLFWAPNGAALMVTLQSPASLRSTLILLDPDTGNQTELPLSLDRVYPYALAIDVDRLRGLPGG